MKFTDTRLTISNLGFLYVCVVGVINCPAVLRGVRKGRWKLERHPKIIRHCLSIWCVELIFDSKSAICESKGKGVCIFSEECVTFEQEVCYFWMCICVLETTLWSESLEIHVAVGLQAIASVNLSFFIGASARIYTKQRDKALSTEELLKHLVYLSSTFPLCLWSLHWWWQ